MKIYVLMISNIFPKTHKRSGDITHFPAKILLGDKIHTIRKNYDLWAKQIKEVLEGRAVISLRYWVGEPYRSKQVEFCQLTKIGLQKLDNPSNFVWAEIDGKKCKWEDVAKNDGLSFDDFCEWFKNYDLSKSMAIIHFTNFRY